MLTSSGAGATDKGVRTDQTESVWMARLKRKGSARQRSAALPTTRRGTTAQHQRQLARGREGALYL